MTAPAAPPGAFYRHGAHPCRAGARRPRQGAHGRYGGDDLGTPPRPAGAAAPPGRGRSP